MAVDLSRPARRLLTCARCRTGYTEGEQHACPTRQVPPDLAWLNLDALSDRQWAGICCVRCGGYLGAPGVRPRQVGAVTDSYGHRLVLYDHGHNTCPNPPPRGR